tara:strand:- start:218 stop:769 length:552 start_codon:yes stop_codon:yes gene_type:complete
MNNLIKNTVKKNKLRQDEYSRIRNGRVNIEGNNIGTSDIPLFEERNNGNELYRRTAVSAIYESTPVQQHFFSAKNISHVQQLLKYNIYVQSGKKHIIGGQDQNNLKIVMKSIYLQYGKNLNTNIQEQVTTLNNYVLDYSVPNILSNIEMHLLYRKQVSNLPVPLEHPKYISDSGTRTNSNSIY